MTQLALIPEPERPAPLVRRRLDGLLRFSDESQADAWLARHGAIWCIERGKTLRLRPREVAGEYLLVAWHSGFPWALEAGKRLRKMQHGDVK